MADTISVVVPARNEAARVGPLLDALQERDERCELIVVDNLSQDGTADLARRRGARVVHGRQPPPGWNGKSWSLQQGLEAASGEVVVCLDADTRPDSNLPRTLAQTLRALEACAPPGAPRATVAPRTPQPGAASGPRPVLLSAGARFRCDTPGERFLHPAMLATLVYRFGPPDSASEVKLDRLLVNGQCLAFRRAALLAEGGFRAGAASLTDDAALARHLAHRGWTVSFRDASALLEVDMHESAAGTWQEWGRSIALRDVTSPTQLWLDVCVVWLTLGLPLLRVISRRRSPFDLPLLLVRGAMTAALAGSYRPRGTAYWLSPLADPLAALRLTLSALRPAESWRGQAITSGGPP